MRAVKHSLKPLPHAEDSRVLLKDVEWQSEEI